MFDYEYRGSYLSEDEVRAKDKETQIDIMKEWFYYHFEDPINETPRLEGEYIYISGGPYDQYDVLGEEFDGIVPEDVIHILAKELCHTHTEWAPTSGGNYYRDGSYSEVDYPFIEFTEVMGNIKTLLSASDNIPLEAVSSMHRLLYANIIIAIEVYLSDTFKNEVADNDLVTRCFVETTSFFKYQKTSISDVYNNMDSIKNRVNDYLTRFLWHRLKETKKMYENTFGVKFPEDVVALNKAILVRHDIIHRNGKTKGGESHEINETDVKDLIDEAKKFVSCINNEMNEKSSNAAIERNL